MNRAPDSEQSGSKRLLSSTIMLAYLPGGAASSQMYFRYPLQRKGTNVKFPSEIRTTIHLNDVGDIGSPVYTVPSIQ